MNLHDRVQSEAALQHFAAYVCFWSFEGAAIMEIEAPLLTVKLLM